MNTFCEWPVDYANCSNCTDWDQMEEGDQDKFERMAGEYLWNWTNRVFGRCDIVLRPCSSSCSGWSAYTNTFWGRGPFPWQGSWDGGAWGPVLVGGEWYNMRCGCVSQCSCAIEGPSSLALPGPVSEITAVRVNGELLDSADYRVAYNRMLVRNDGGVWPSCQDLMALPTEEDTFEIVYKRGLSVPIGGQLAAGLLASEFAKAACSDNSCQLPKRISSIVREGVTVTLMDDFKSLQEGATGIWMIDNWVQSVMKPARPYASVRSVDVARPKVPGYGY